jgi:transcriptional regulator GlxA family with amidase domain
MQRIGFVVPERFKMLGLLAQMVFEYANMSAGKAVYEVRVLSEKGRPMRSTVGIALQTERFSGMRFDTLIFGGTNGAMPSIHARTIELRTARIENVETRGIQALGKYDFA